MITIEIRNASEAKTGLAEVEIFCDPAGLDELLRQITFLKNGSTHVHLLTPAWAGTELDETAVGKNTDLVNHLRITSVSAEK